MNPIGDHSYPHCSNQIPSDLTFFEHLCLQHIDFKAENLCTLLENSDDELFSLAKQILNLSFPQTLIFNQFTIYIFIGLALRLVYNITLVL